MRRLIWEPLEKHLAQPASSWCRRTESWRVARWRPAGRQPGTYLLEEMPLATLAVPQMLPEWLEPAAVTRETNGTRSWLPAAGWRRRLRRGSTARGRFVWPDGVAASSGDRRGSARLSATAGRGAGDRVGDCGSLASSAARRRSTCSPRPRPPKQAVRRQAPTHRYVHLATHGFFAPPQMRSAFTTVMGDPRAVSAPIADQRDTRSNDLRISSEPFVRTRAGGGQSRCGAGLDGNADG